MFITVIHHFETHCLYIYLIMHSFWMSRCSSDIGLTLKCYSIPRVILNIIWSVNSLWPSDTIWQHKSESTLLWVMVCGLWTPSHYLDQYWLIISEIPWHLHGSSFTVSAKATVLYNEFESSIFDIMSIFPATNELSSRHDDAFKNQLIVFLLVQIMVWCLFNDIPI